MIALPVLNTLFWLVFLYEILVFGYAVTNLDMFDKKLPYSHSTQFIICLIVFIVCAAITRVLFEFLIVIFKIHQNTEIIANHIGKTNMFPQIKNQTIEDDETKNE